jgi:hypothetical protein
MTAQVQDRDVALALPGKPRAAGRRSAERVLLVDAALQRLAVDAV